MRLLLGIILLITSFASTAKPMSYDVKQILGGSKYIDEVIIKSFDSTGNIHFESLRYPDTINSSNSGSSNKLDFSNNSSLPIKSGQLPNPGDTVLIFVDYDNSTTFYAEIEKSHYRLWSSQFPWSTPLFYFEPPIQALPNQYTQSNTPNYLSCSDGCLIPKDSLTGLIHKYRKELLYRQNTINLQQFENDFVYSLWYNDTTKHHASPIWGDEPPGVLQKILLPYSTGKTLEIQLNNSESRVFDITRKFTLDKVKEKKISRIRWIE